MDKQVGYEVAGANDAGQRVDNYIMLIKRGVPRSRIYRAIRKGEVRVNKGRVKPTTRLSEGDIVRIPPMSCKEGASEEYKLAQGQAKSLKEKIIFENNEYIVINKDAGIAVHSGSGASYGLIDQYNQIFDEKIYLVHRLDKAVSGCILLSKSRQSMVKAQAEWKNSKTNKIYHALVFYDEMPRVNKIEQNLIGKDGREISAVTRFRILKKSGKVLLVEIRLDTGRKHQIRKHMSSIQLPLIGDDKYGDYRKNSEFVGEYGVTGLMLHAYKLSVYGTKINCCAEYPGSLKEAIAILQMD